MKYLRTSGTEWEMYVEVKETNKRDEDNVARASFPWINKGNSDDSNKDEQQ